MSGLLFSHTHHSSIIPLQTAITVHVWVDIECLCDFVCLFVSLPASCSWFRLSCHCNSVPTSHAGTQKKPVYHPGWLDYTERDSGTCCHDIDDTTCVTPLLSLCHLAMLHSVRGPGLFLASSLLVGRWWGAVIYKKWLGGNSSNMICVGAHKSSPSVTLKEWNGRGPCWFGSRCRIAGIINAFRITLWDEDFLLFFEFLSILMTTISF